jgi:hypothetical protein
MNEEEWLGGTDLRRMLHYARASRVSDRKLRHFAVSCCNLIRQALTDARSRKAVEVAERFAEGLASDDELRAAYDRADSAAREAFMAVGKIGSSPQHVALFAAEPNAIDAAKRVCSRFHSAALVAASSGKCPSGAESEEQFNFLRDICEDEAAVAKAVRTRALLPDLLREIIGNPFRPMSVHAAVLAWNDGCVVRHAQAAYDVRDSAGGTLDNTRLAILADALEDAGCTNQDMLSHCRINGPHVRGCFVLDLLLGRT